MSGKTYLDSDKERLPDGMTRIGYDADTQVYSYYDATDNTYWRGAPGRQYGTLVPAPDLAPTPTYRSSFEEFMAERGYREVSEGEWVPIDEEGIDPPSKQADPPRRASLMHRAIAKLKPMKRLARSISVTSTPAPGAKGFQKLRGWKFELGSKKGKAPEKAPSRLRDSIVDQSPLFDKDEAEELFKPSTWGDSSKKDPEEGKTHGANRN